MARPQKFRHSREALNDPQIAEKLGGFVLDIEALRTKRKQIDDQISAAYDAVDDAGFEKKYVRKVMSLRAKETDARRDEEEGLEAYEFAVEKGVSLASARSKPVSSQSYAEAKGREYPNPYPEFTASELAELHRMASSELTDTQEQPETSPADEIPAGSHGQCHELVAGPEDRQHMSPVTADAVASVSEPISPSPANAPRLAADDEAAQANPIAVGTLPNPQPTSSLGADKAGDIPPPPSPASSFNNPRCQHPGTCSHAHSKSTCQDCLLKWADLPKAEQVLRWQDAVAASETEAV